MRSYVPNSVANIAGRALFAALICAGALVNYLGASASQSIEVDVCADVYRVVDGDTFDAFPVGRVRLADIDAPELGTPEGEASRQALSNLVSRHGPRVYLDVDDIYVMDRYYRIVAVAYLRHNSTHLLNVNKWLVDNGYASIADYANEFNPYAWSLYVYLPYDPCAVTTKTVTTYVVTTYTITSTITEVITTPKTVTSTQTVTTTYTLTTERTVTVPTTVTTTRTTTQVLTQTVTSVRTSIVTQVTTVTNTVTSPTTHTIVSTVYITLPPSPTTTTVTQAITHTFTMQRTVTKTLTQYQPITQTIAVTYTRTYTTPSTIIETIILPTTLTVTAETSFVTRTFTESIVIRPTAETVTVTRTQSAPATLTVAVTETKTLVEEVSATGHSLLLILVLSVMGILLYILIKRK